MRIAIAVASLAFFAASGSAFAADCGKGMLWPYVRVPGDCLTDVELKAGQTGVYSGPATTNVDVSAIKPDAATVEQQNTTTSTAGTAPSSSGSGTLLGSVLGEQREPSRTAAGCNKGLLWPFMRDPGDCLTATEKKTNKTGVYGQGALTQVSATSGNAPAGTAPAGATPANAPAPESKTPACNKSWLWPFVRSGNDCPTTAEKNAQK
jgi:hypothetical protein